MAKQSRTAAKQLAVIAALRENFNNVTVSCEAADVDPSTYHKWMKRDKKFRAKVKAARRLLEEELWAQVCRRTKGQGEGDAKGTLTIFALKSLNRRRYDDMYARTLLEKKLGLDKPDDAPAGNKVVLEPDEEPERFRKKEGE